MASDCPPTATGRIGTFTSAVAPWLPFTLTWPRQVPLSAVPVSTTS